MTRRSFLSTAAAGAAFPAASPKPNVVLMLLDDLGWRDFGCYGNTFHETPNIDRLARDGVRFTQAYAACPVCSPTRAALLTGKYPARLHVTDWIPGRKQWPSARVLTPEFEQQLPLREVTIAEALKPAGYRSASVGKWHLGAEGFAPTDQGFDVNVAGDRRGSPMSYFAPYKFVNLESRAADESLTERLTEEAAGFMESSVRASQPFFLYFPHYSPHIPLKARERVVEKYTRKGGTAERNNPVYAAMVESIDDSLGRIRAKIEELGIASNTVILLTSDNGGLRYEGRSKNPVAENAPLRAGKGHLYEGGIREPLLALWPGVTKAGSTVDAPVSSIDFLPTILEMAGVRSPSPVDGMSLAGALRGRPLRRDALFWHYPHYSNQGGVPGGVVRMGDYKLIEFYEDGHLELFHLPSDPGEQKNLAVKDGARARRMLTRLREWRKSVDASMPRPNPAYDAATEDQGLTGHEKPTPPVQ